MADITQKGRLLAAKVARYTKYESNWRQQEQVCSLIARHATEPSASGKLSIVAL